MGSGPYGRDSLPPWGKVASGVSRKPDDGNTSFATAGCAGSSEEFSGSTGRILAGVTAGLAALGLILEASLSVEFLLAGGENELIAALFAN